jgi:hypothetical protein
MLQKNRTAVTARNELRRKRRDAAQQSAHGNQLNGS